MLTITKHSAERVKDPFGILTGERYEFLLDLELPEDDELYSENGIYARVIFKVDGEHSSIVTSNLTEKVTNRVLDFDLEPEELQTLADYCKQNLPEA